MVASHRLIVNADDFGLSAGINRGIIQAHSHGIVTSASLMVRWPHAEEAAEHARRQPGLSLGLHFDLAEWAFEDGDWRALYEVVRIEDAVASRQELLRQLSEFRRLVGRDPTHLDSHQHVHLREPLHSIVTEIAQELDLPLRQCDSRVRYCGDFYGQEANGTPYADGVTVERLLGILGDLQPGTTELACHPAESVDFLGMYRHERLRELEVLCDPRVAMAVLDRGIELCSFDDFAGLSRPASD